MAERRRLPVVQSAPPPASPSGASGDDDSIEDRPPWHWVGFGTVAVFAAWLPLAWVAQSLGERIMKSRLAGIADADVPAHLARLSGGEIFAMFLPMAIFHVIALGLASAAGGYLVGRFGSGTTVREPSLTGGVVALIAIMLTFSRGGGASLAATGAIILLVAVGSAALGGRRGLRKKDKGAPIAPST